MSTRPRSLPHVPRPGSRRAAGALGAASALLAADGASFIQNDWTTAPADAVLTDVLPRG